MNCREDINLHCHMMKKGEPANSDKLCALFASRQFGYQEKLPNTLLKVTVDNFCKRASKLTLAVA